MQPWTPFPQTNAFALDVPTLQSRWEALHCADQEPLPTDAAVLQAWVHYHRGEFQQAYESGLQLGPAGRTVANKAACMHATFLEPREKPKHEIFNAVAQRCAQQVTEHPEDFSAHYLQGYALGRYSQGINVAKSLALGLGGRVKHALETTIALAPLHADAYIALGTFHAEVIDKVGAMIGSMTYGAKKATSLALFDKGLALAPHSPVALMEYAHALVMLEGESRHGEATALFERALACTPQDAVEFLEIGLARAELAA